MAVSIVRVEHPELFVGPPAAPEQIVRVTVAGDPGPLTVGVSPGSELTAQLSAGELTVEVPVPLADRAVGTEVPAVVTVRGPAGEARTDVTIPVAEPGWTAYLVPHFHYDPVWWTTQAAYTEAWDEKTGPDSARQAFQLAGFDLVRAHLETARHDLDYRFVLAETDYLKPWWDTVPAERAFLRRLLAEGRCELVGGTYNEPNTNLTAVESTIRNLAYGIALQRDVLGGNPETAWQLDAFGHDPQFPGLCAGAGLTASSWARGPFHQWGPIQTHGGYGDARVMQFPSEFEWVAPSGTGLLTAYMPAHYSAGWWMDSAPTLAEAEAAVHDLFRSLQPVAATRNVLIPVGTDYSPPNKWVTEIHRDWNARYTWPRFVCAVPRDFLAAVRAELAAEGRAAGAGEPGHEPGLHRQGRLLHRHQAGQPGGRGPGRRRGAVRHPGRAARRPLPARGARPGLAAAALRRPPRRGHRQRGRPGLPRPAGRLAGRLDCRRAPCSTPPPGTSCRRWTPPAPVSR